MKLGQDIFRLIGWPKELLKAREHVHPPPPPEPVTGGSTFDPPVAAAGLPQLQLTPERNLAIARRLVRAGGSGDASDVEAVAQELATLPTWMLERAEQYKLKVVACRGSVTDYQTELRGVHPRGWPPGVTWDQIPGSGGNPVVIATIAATDGTRIVPPTGRGHGSESLLQHEFAHALDHKGALGKKSTSREFMAAWRADAGYLEHEDKTYLLQAAPGGPEEAFAEMLDWYVTHKGEPPMWGPNMYTFFAALDHRQGGGR